MANRQGGGSLEISNLKELVLQCDCQLRSLWQIDKKLKWTPPKDSLYATQAWESGN